MINLDILEKQAKLAYLAIGSNLGNKKLNIEIAKYKLIQHDISIIACSSNYETLSWPNPKEPSFINLVIKIETLLSPQELMKKCLLIENILGRKRLKKNAPRTCDIDIIDYNSQIINMKNENLIIPHPNMHIRNFVLLPLFEITKSWIHPSKKKNIQNLIKSLDIKELRTIKQI